MKKSIPKKSRIVIILKNLNTPKTPEELTKIVYPEFDTIDFDKLSISKKREFMYKKRNVYNDLKLLRDLPDFVDYDKTNGTYQKAGIKKKNSKTKLNWTWQLNMPKI